MKFRTPGSISIALAASLGACTHQPMASTPAGKETAVIEQGTPRMPGLHSQDAFPDMTPEEMGRRFLRFIDSLQRYDQLTLDRLEQVMQLKLDGPEGGRGKQFNIRMPESGWHYVVGYSEEEDPPHYRSAALSFAHDEDTYQADMAPVCGLHFDDYVETLRAMGFEEREDMAQYEQAHYVPVMNENGETVDTLVPGRRISGYYFSRGDVGVMIDHRAEAVEPEARRRRACVLMINLIAAAPRR